MYWHHILYCATGSTCGMQYTFVTSRDHMVNPETSFRSEHHTNTYLLKSRTQAISPIPDLERRQKCAAKLRSLCACQKIVELINAHADIPECSICTSVIIEPVKISAPLCSEHFLLKDIVHLWKLVDELVMNGRNTSCVYHLNICTLKKGVVHACKHVWALFQWAPCKMNWATASWIALCN